MANETVSELYAKLSPYIAGAISTALKGAAVGGGGGDSSGVISDVRLPQFLKLDGSRIMTGSLRLTDGLLVDGVDISAVRIAPQGGIAGGGSLGPSVPVGIDYSYAGSWNALQHFTASIALPLAPGTVPFADANTVLSSDPANLLWDNTFKRLGLGTATPQVALHVATATGNTAAAIQANDPAGTGQASLILQGMGTVGGSGSAVTGVLMYDNTTLTGAINVAVNGLAATRNMTIQSYVDRDANPLPLYLNTYNASLAPVQGVVVGAGLNAGRVGIAGAPNSSYQLTVTGSTFLNGQLTLNSTFNAQHIIPQLPDTYDLGSPTILWRKGYLSEMDALLFAKLTISPIGGWLMLSPNEGTLAAAALATDTTMDFGTTVVPGHMIVFRGLLMVEYVQVGTSAAVYPSYGYQVTALTATGETMASPEVVSSTITTLTGSVVVSWPAVTGATGYSVFGRTAGAETRLIQLGTVLTWTDTGSVVPSVIPAPSVSTATVAVPAAPTATVAANTGRLAGTNANVTSGSASALVSDANTAYTFNGTTSSVTTAATALPTTAWTFECWVKRGRLLTQEMIIGHGSNPGTPSSTLGLGFDATDHLIFSSWTDNLVSTSTIASTTGWHHVCFCYTVATKLQEMFLDGVAVGTRTSTNAYINITSPILFGRRPDTVNANWFQGSLDEVALYNVRLPDATILAHFQANI